jgi:hypothetical protein
MYRIIQDNDTHEFELTDDEASVFEIESVMQNGIFRYWYLRYLEFCHPKSEYDDYHIDCATYYVEYYHIEEDERD